MSPADAFSLLPDVFVISVARFDPNQFGDLFPAFNSSDSVSQLLTFLHVLRDAGLYGEVWVLVRLNTRAE